MPSYEQLLEWISELERPQTTSQRNIRWATDSHVIGISKTPQDRIELFLAGPELHATSTAIKEAIEYQPWWHLNAQEAAFTANRLLLPSAGHFVQVAAFLCAELIRCGADDDLVEAFKKAEPVIELAIERLRLSDAAFLGLAGELLLLGAMCSHVSDLDVVNVVESWAGWQKSLRDFNWGTTGAEVKTTTKPISTHPIQGTHQVELGEIAVGGQEESKLYLVSVGLQPTAPHENSFTVPSIANGIIARLQRAHREDVVSALILHMQEYGSASGFGYDHRTMSEDPSFSRSFATAFVRAYDMIDPNVSVLRREDVLRFQHVDARSVTYSIDLPARVSGSINPVVGLNQAARAILGLTGASNA
ncbi:PD-(D/E)XK motif protein [Pseudarthrobacter enclensis]|uniref:PD-(D/E)XK motif protein n=1 Tax=Pseudarthrobacter enclensis TaxID=993070 RepID=UPI003EE06FCA